MSLGRWRLRSQLLPALRSAGGHVVFINSGAGINASPGLASYSASKFALRGSRTRCATTSRSYG